MLDNHEKATESPEADLIQQNIEPHLDRLSSLLSEVQYRIKKWSKPQNIFSHPWFKIAVTIYLAVLFLTITCKMIKKLTEILTYIAGFIWGTCWK